MSSDYQRARPAATLPTIIVALVALACLGPSHAHGEDAPLYEVRDGKVDAGTYAGWRAFHSACHGCHGVDAVGTSVAPDLVARIRDLSSRDFSTKVLTRYRITLGAGEVAADDDTTLREAFLEQVLKRERGDLIMPAWSQDPNVSPHVLDMYAYLRARSDGVLGPGRPGRLDERAEDSPAE
jgi:hypothetical protein